MNDFLNEETNSAMSNNNTDAESNSNKRANSRPLGNRFPKDPTLIAALRKHENEWHAILGSLTTAFGVRVVSLGNTLSR